MVGSCGLDQDFDLYSDSLLRWHSLLNWKWSERLSVCDPRVCGALLFICMVAGLCWHFSNLPWLCKVFLQTFLHFASQFCNLKAISMLGGDFTAHSKLGDHFIAILQLKSDFPAQNWFRSSFCSCKMSVRGFEMALMCQKLVSQLKGDFTAVS